MPLTYSTAQGKVHVQTPVLNISLKNLLSHPLHVVENPHRYLLC